MTASPPARQRRAKLASFACVALLPTGLAAAPQIGYVYPAGGRAGTSFEVIVGGQRLDLPLGAVISGEGVRAEIVEHYKIPSAQVVDDYRDKLRGLRPELDALKESHGADRDALLGEVPRVLAAGGLDEKTLWLMREYYRRRNDPKQQLNSQIAETVRLRVTVEESADEGMRFWRLLTASGLSNPVRFAVGRYPEHHEPDPHPFELLEAVGLAPPASAPRQRSEGEPPGLPATFNGRILPGEVDEFVFRAEGGEQLVVSLEARALIPYLADAVPGWFQAVVSVHDSRGRELAFADDYRFSPDPVIFYRIPRGGDYRLRIRDSIYRGREDFVYRVSLGELPFVTGIEPLGAQAGSEVELLLHGANLSRQEIPRFLAPASAGIHLVRGEGAAGLSNPVAFHVETLPEQTEREPNDRLGPTSNPVVAPCIVNGSIAVPGDVDFFRVEGPGNRPMSFEIFARRLGSPLDANLTVFDDQGEIIGYNDDHEDPSAGLTTHHADSRVVVPMPANGRAFVRVADTQNRYGYAYAYRLRIAPAEPRFLLRITPSSLNAAPGGSARATAHVLRIDAFDGPVRLQLRSGPDGVSMGAATIPAGEDSAPVSLSVSSGLEDETAVVSLVGIAEIDGKTVEVDAVGADDVMQAFIYRHLVPADALLLDVRSPTARIAPADAR